MDKRIFPHDKPFTGLDKCLWWVIALVKTDKDFAQGYSGFAGLRVENKENMGYLCRAGVIKAYRSQGLHKRLIQVRLRAAKKLGLEGCYTYTMIDNTYSSNALYSCGFKMYRSAEPWAGETNVLYWKLVF